MFTLERNCKLSSFHLIIEQNTKSNLGTSISLDAIILVTWLKMFAILKKNLFLVTLQKIK